MNNDPGPLPDTVDDLLTGLLRHACERKELALAALFSAQTDVTTATKLLNDWQALKSQGTTVQGLSSDVQDALKNDYSRQSRRG